MKLNALFSALLVAGSLTLVSSSAHATFSLLGGLGSICTTPSAPTGIDCTPSFGGLFGNNNCDLFGNPLGGIGGGIGSICNTPMLGKPGIICNPFNGSPSNVGGICDIFGNNNGGGINYIPGGFGNGGNGNNCNPGGGTGGGGTSPVPEPGSIALLALGATALGGTVLRRARK